MKPSGRPLRRKSAADREPAVQNYFNYFTEIEEHFQRRRGTILLLSTLDWALIETWKEAGIPLEAALRGIDVAMDRYERRPSKTRKVNSLAFCSQEVLAAAEEMKEAAVGASPQTHSESSGLSLSEVRDYLTRNALTLQNVKLPEIARGAAQSASEVLASHAALIAQDQGNSKLRLEDLERQLTVLEEKLLAALLTSTSNEELLQIRAEADRQIAPYQSKMNAPQIDQLRKQFVQKRLLERYKLPRLSLFYM
jgi:hypothetical protein